MSIIIALGESYFLIDAVQEARRQGIDLLTLPSLTSHAMQVPLDICLFKPFKTAFKAYGVFWTFRSAEATSKKENLAKWVSLVLRRALSVQNIQKGFWVTGIWLWDDLAMAAKFGPSGVFHAPAVDVPDAMSHLPVDEISSDLLEPENSKTQHYYVTVHKGKEVVLEGIQGAVQGGMRSAIGELACSDEDISLNHESPLLISRFLTLPDVTVTKHRRRLEALADYSKLIILTSENYISRMEEKLARKDEVERAKAEKKELQQLEKQRKEKERINELKSQKLREEERAQKKSFDKL